MITNYKIFETITSPDLIMAVKSNKSIKVKTLINAGLDVNCTDNMEWTPLLWAVYMKNTTMIKMLIDAGADMHYKAYHYIKGTKDLVDFYDLAVAKEYHEGTYSFNYKGVITWIEKNYPEFVAAKKYNL